MTKQLNNGHCASCGEFAFATTDYIDRYYRSNQVIDWQAHHIVYCQSCGLGFIAPDVPADKLTAFYESFYRADSASAMFANGSGQGLLDSFRVDPRSLSQATTVAMMHDFHNQEILRFLDVGCGETGNSFYSFSRVFSNKKLQHFAVEADCVSIGNLERSAVTVIGRGCESVKEYVGQFDIVLMSHCMEHLTLAMLDGFLPDLRRALTANGVCLVDVPLDDFRIEERQGQHSSPHTTFFTQEAMRNLLTHHGFELLYLKPMDISLRDWVNSNESDCGSTGGQYRSLMSKLIPLFSRSARNRVKQMLADPYDVFQENYYQVNSGGTTLRALFRSSNNGDSRRTFDE